MGTSVFSEKKNLKKRKKKKKTVFWTIFYWNLNETIITAGKKGKNVALKGLL